MVGRLSDGLGWVPMTYVRHQSPVLGHAVRLELNTYRSVRAV